MFGPNVRPFNICQHHIFADFNEISTDTIMKDCQMRILKLVVFSPISY